MTMEHLHLLLIGASVGLSAGILVMALRDSDLPPRIRGLVAAVAVSGAAYSLTTAQAWADWADGAGLALRWVATLGVVALWHLVRVLFDDRRGWGACWVAAAVASAAVLANPLWLQRPGGMSLGITAVAGALVLHILWMLLRGRVGDLDEGRRRLRLWWVAAAGLYVITVLVVHHLPWDGAGTAGHGIALVSGQITIKLCWLLMASGHPSALAMLSLQSQAPAPASTFAQRTAAVAAAAAPHRPAPAERQAAATPGTTEALTVPPAEALRRLQARRICEAMTGERLYQRPRLSVSDLAGHLRMPEARLRLVIHDQLGFRHFNTFLNQFRLAEVAARLRNPADAHLPVLTLALEAGFGSIGPFNRAFREAYGVTPTEFRRGEGPPGIPRLAESSDPLAESLGRP
ncbi:MAG TPA: helix-turn-helix transcriptional regulator [Rhizobacter sp.]